MGYIGVDPVLVLWTLESRVHSTLQKSEQEVSEIGRYQENLTLYRTGWEEVNVADFVERETVESVLCNVRHK